MVIHLLVSGLIPYDSGKTTFAVSLAKKLKMSTSVHPFKPVSAHSIFTQSWSFEESYRRGYLIGGDALIYERELGLMERDLLRINPIDFLLSPISSPTVLTREELNEYMKSMENQLKTMAVARITDCQDGRSKHYLIVDNIDSFPSKIRNKIDDFSRKVNSEKEEISELLKLMRSREIERNLDTCLDYLEKNSRIVITESFSDSLYPYAGILGRANMIAVVAPGKAYIYLDASKVQSLISTGKISPEEPRSVSLLLHSQPDFWEDLSLGDPISAESKILSRILSSL
ncbi:MAG: hypothetical protein QW397_01465 [Fervidicoccaceae archaeon]